MAKRWSFYGGGVSTWGGGYLTNGATPSNYLNIAVHIDADIQLKKFIQLTTAKTLKVPITKQD